MKRTPSFSKLLRATPLVGATLVIAGSGALTGCGDTKNVLASTTLSAAGNDVSGSDAAAPRLAPPTLAELKTLLNLSDEQAAAVGKALEDWTSAASRRHGPPPGGRDGMGPGPFGGRRRGGPDGGFPGGGPGGPGASGDRPMGPPGGPEGGPAIGFLADVAGTLDPQQFVSLVHFLVERREAAMADEPGLDRPNPRLDRFAERNKLTDAQKDAMRDAWKTAAAGLRDLRKGIVDGTVSGDAIRDQAGQIRTTLAGKLTDILGADLFATLSGRIGEMRQRVAERILPEVGKHVDQHATMLARLLGLSDGQKAQVTAALQAAVPNTQALLSDVRDGKVPFEEALSRGYQIETTTEASIRSTLTPEQAQKLDALKAMLARPQPFRIYF